MGVILSDNEHPEGHSDNATMSHVGEEDSIVVSIAVNLMDMSSLTKEDITKEVLRFMSPVATNKHVESVNIQIGSYSDN